MFTAADAVEAGERGPRRDPRAPVHRGRRRRRLPRRQGDPHVARAARPRTRRWSRAAWAARRWSAPTRWRSTSRPRRSAVDGKVVHEGDFIAIDGTKRLRHARGRAAASSRRSTSTSSACSSGPTRSAGSACARTPTRRRTPRGPASSGAEGIGLCRTEHMFMAEDRQPKMRAMIMADDTEARREALGELLPLQQEDFEGLFEAMRGLPVTIRLLDPPLHEFLPNLPGAARGRRARPHRVHRRPGRAGADAGPRGGDPRGEPDARHPRGAARDPHAGDLRDAGRGDHARGQGGATRRRTRRS